MAQPASQPKGRRRRRQGKGILKRCQRCGWVGKVRPRIRHCRQQKFGSHSFWCYGRLDPVARVRTAATEAIVPVAEARQLAKLSPQQKAAEQFAHARKQAAACRSRIKRATTDLAKWERKAEYYAERASMSDEQYAQLVQAGRDRRATREQQRKEAKRYGRAILPQRSGHG